MSSCHPPPGAIPSFAQPLLVVVLYLVVGGLHFAIGDHFRSRGILGGDPPFLDIVPLRFSIAEPEGHYHVPLLCTPWSYSTYRGS